jgi:DNA (cytosine-5)-methyltransferase 1
MAMIANHITAGLSPLDLQTIEHVPPGGNWKDIPPSVPSQRLEGIRASFARGEGSRSTYYGRLRWDAPSYTINTYYSRPGNGCHIHPRDDRTLSAREAARLQSFPDAFQFVGSLSSVAKQIGNAVPPLLAYQVARSLGEPGAYIDLFCGAGGLSYGFKLAGWQPLVANDVDARFLDTYATNIHDNVVLGDIRRDDVRAELVRKAFEAREAAGKARFVILGGPPCQGFSTAGNRRSRADERNHLFRDYRRIVDALEPDGFVFENVSGLLNMEGGRVFAELVNTIGAGFDELADWVLHAEQHAIPQRRTRVFLVGHAAGWEVDRPPAVSAWPPEVAADRGVCAAPTVADAIGDLPRLGPAHDGQELHYGRDATSAYQRVMRGMIGFAEYLALFDAGTESGLTVAL